MKAHAQIRQKFNIQLSTTPGNSALLPTKGVAKSFNLNNSMVERTTHTHWNMHACSFVVSFGYPMAHFVVSGGYAGEIPPVVAYV